jgi:hypothetical protein
MFESLPTDRDRRWELMREFLSRWYSSLSPGDGFDGEELGGAERRLGFPLPSALREWYGLSGRRKDVWSRQDEMLPPEKLYVANGVLVFYVENQSVVRWGIRQSERGQDDPPVVVEDDESPGRWLTENGSTSEFALQMLVFSAKWSSRNTCWANGGADEDVVRLIERSYPRLAFPDWHWPAFPTRLYGGGEIVIETNGRGENTWLWVCSRTEEEFRKFEGLVGGTGLMWEASSDSDAWPSDRERTTDAP